MTVSETEARRLLDEHRACPCFVRGRQAYACRPDGRVDVFRVTPGDRRIYELTVDRASYAIPADIRARLA
jgi:hypothetical protein